MSKVSEAVAAWKLSAESAGWRIEAKVLSSDPSGGVITIEKSFTPDSSTEYVSAEVEASRLMSRVPRVSYGTTWGTTSDGVGGHAGLRGGYMRLSASGVSKRWITVLNKGKVAA